ncbi:MAG: hypothetical protein PHO37_17455 [Kiritimatiellae bacterium]|nr:hypothetical protein [Kiritimatiellia bacterium]
MKWEPIDFTITAEILVVFAKIERLTGKVEGVHLSRATPKLRKKNQARSVWGSTGIEGGSGSLAQVEAIMRDESVALSKKEQLEIRNALQAYKEIASYDPFSVSSLLQAHAQLMGGGLMLQAGSFRQTPVEVYITEEKTRAMPPWPIIPEAIRTKQVNETLHTIYFGCGDELL